MAQKILVIDDEVKIVEICSDYLRAAHFDVIAAGDGLKGLALARSQKPDLIVLDLMLPGMDGLDLCQTLRRESKVPIVMLTARVEESDKLAGLELGADDYITKPFSARELVARVRTVLRRASGDSSSDLIRVGEVTLDRSHYQASLPDRSVSLTSTEFELLATMMSQPGRIFTRTQLLNAVRGVAFESYERAIDSHIRNLRRKLEPGEYIITVHGIGYKFEGMTMARSVSVRSIRNRLFLLLLRAFGIAVAFLVLFTLLVTWVVLARPARSNPIFQLPITSSLETYYIARGNWNGVSTIFNNSQGIERPQWRNSLLLDTQNRIIVQYGQAVDSSASQIYQTSSNDIPIPIQVNGKVVGTLILEERTRPSEIVFVFRYLLPIILSVPSLGHIRDLDRLVAYAQGGNSIV